MTVTNTASNSEIRVSVLRLYEQARADNTQPFDPDRFLASLTHPPASNGRGVADTFAGRRRLVRFLQSVQFEFGICFTNGDWETGFTLDRFVERIATKMTNPNAEHRLAAKRLAEERSGLISDPIRYSIFTLPFLFAAVAVDNLFIRILLGSLCIAITGVIVTVTIKAYQFAKKLFKRTGDNVA